MKRNRHYNYDLHYQNLWFSTNCYSLFNWTNFRHKWHLVSHHYIMCINLHENVSDERQIVTLCLKWFQSSSKTMLTNRDPIFKEENFLLENPLHVRQNTSLPFPKTDWFLVWCALCLLSSSYEVLPRQ